MELGALLCSPTSPECKKCPVKDECLALSDVSAAIQKSFVKELMMSITVNNQFKSDSLEKINFNIFFKKMCLLLLFWTSVAHRILL